MWPGIFAVLLILELVIQVSSGVYSAERGVYADEAVHFTNGILIRDYARTGIGQSPMHFAERFYLSFPKIAPFMWPPLLHIMLGALMLIPLPAAWIGLAVMALLTTWVAIRAAHAVSREHGVLAGLSVGIVFLGLRVVQDSSTSIMADLLVAAMAIEAAWHLAKYWETRSLRSAKWFGVFTGLACFAKGNGLVVILMCGVLLVLTWKWEILRDKGLYWAAAFVALLAGPFMAISWFLYDTNSAFHPVNYARIRRFTTEYLALYVDQSGLLWAVLAFAGIVVILFQNRKPLGLTLFSLWFATVFFHSVTSQGTGTEPRYVLLGFAPFVMFVPYGITWLAERVPGLGGNRQHLAGAVMILLAAVFYGSTFSVLHRPAMGYRDAATFLKGRIAPGDLVLIASDASGEGAFVSEFAAMEPRPDVYILRSTKILADQDWMGNHFRMRYDSPEQALDDFEKMKINYFLVDETPEMQRQPCVKMASLMVRIGASRLERVATFNPQQGASRSIAVYRLTNPATGPRKPFRVSIQYSMGRSLER